MFYWLVGWIVFIKVDGIVCYDMDDVLFYKGG